MSPAVQPRTSLKEIVALLVAKGYKSLTTYQLTPSQGKGEFRLYSKGYSSILLQICMDGEWCLFGEIADCATRPEVLTSLP